MSFLNILVYDYTQKAQFDYFFAALMLLLLLIGFLLIKASKAPDMSRPKTSVITLIQLALLRTNPKKNKLFGRIALFTGILLTAVYTYNYAQVKKPERFYEVGSITGRVENVNSKTIKAGVETTFSVKGYNFTLVKDKGYLANRDLTANDSVTLHYYNDPNPRLPADQKNRIVRLEVVE